MEAAKWIRFAVLAAFAGLFLWLFYARYWKRGDCVAAAKPDCLSAAGDSLAVTGAFWIVPALLFALLALATLRRR